MSNVLPTPQPTSTASGYLAGKRYRMVFGALLLLLLSYPYLEQTSAEFMLLDLLISLVLLSGLYSVSNHPSTFWIGLVLVLPAILGSWWPQGTYHPLPHYTGMVCSIFSLAFVTIVMFSDVFGTEEVTTDTLFGAVCVYLLIGLTWSSAYTLLETLAPGSFNLAEADASRYLAVSSELIFFSYTTLSTTGYGDITPLTDQARSLVILEYSAGVLYVAILVARLVSLHR